MEMWCLYSGCGHRSIYTLLQLNTGQREWERENKSERREVDVKWKKINNETLWLVAHIQTRAQFNFHTPISNTNAFFTSTSTSSVPMCEWLPLCLFSATEMWIVWTVDGVHAFLTKGKCWMYNNREKIRKHQEKKTKNSSHQRKVTQYDKFQLCTMNYAVTWSAHLKQRVCTMRSYELLQSLHSTPKQIQYPFFGKSAAHALPMRFDLVIKINNIHNIWFNLICPLWHLNGLVHLFTDICKIRWIKPIRPIKPIKSRTN